MKFLVFLAALVGVSNAHREYMDRIPNGHKVPNPCGSEVWEAVGHNRREDGHHGKNQFGNDFKHVGHERWSIQLCQMDSDGDGVTNGAELGDPECTWTEGKTPSGPATGHPGICTPLTSARCGSAKPCENV